MVYNEIGKTGMHVSNLGFGASSLGGVFHSVREDEGIRAVHEAIDNGEYIRLRGVDFGAGAKQFSIFAAAMGSCTVTLRLDSENGPIIGSVKIGSTGSVDAYKLFSTKIKDANSVHDLYLCFGDAQGEVHLDYWMFK